MTPSSPGCSRLPWTCSDPLFGRGRADAVDAAPTSILPTSACRRSPARVPGWTPMSVTIRARSGRAAPRTTSVPTLDEATLAPTWLAQLRPGSTRPSRSAARWSPTRCRSRPWTPTGGRRVRTVLAKGIDERGVVFYTNYESAKGRDLEAQPYAAAQFVWLAARAAGAADRRGRAGVARARPPPTSRPARVARSSAPGPRRSRRWSPRAPSSSAAAPRSTARFGDGEVARAAALGRLPHRAGGGRVLAGPPRPAARPAAVPPRPTASWILERLAP